MQAEWLLAKTLQQLRHRRPVRIGTLGRSKTVASRLVKPRIMYIESKASGLTGQARIGRVTFSKSGRTIYYRGQEFRSLDGAGFKANYYDVATGEELGRRRPSEWSATGQAETAESRTR